MKYHSLVYWSHSTLHGYKPDTGYLEAYEKIGDRPKRLPYTVTAKDCENGKVDNDLRFSSRVAHCTFDNGAKRSYLAGFDALCGVEEPSASLEIVETSTKKNGEYYTPGETITYDYVLTNTGNIILEYMTLKTKEGGATISFGNQNLMPGESATVYSGSKTVTAEMLKSGKTIDVTGYADCLFKSAAPNGTAKASAEDKKSFDIGGKPSAELYLNLMSAPENDKYIEGETVEYSAVLFNNGELDMTGAELKVSFNGGAAVALATVPGLAPDEMSDDHPFTHTVTEPDTQLDELKCVVTGECTFADGTVLPVSAEASVDIGNPALKVDIMVSSTAPEGFYKRNEQVEYQVTVSNIGNMDFESLRATIMPADNEKGYTYILQMDGFVAGASETRAHTYTVTMDDVAAGSVTAETEAFGVLPSGKEITATASVSVETGMLPIDLSVEKTVTSTSTYGFYEENDTISYLITVTNNGKEAIPSVAVTDISPAGATMLDAIMEMAPGASLSYPYSYTVTGSDVTAGNVHNIGGIDAVLPDGSGYSATSEVDSATGKHVSPEEGGDGTGPVVWYLHEMVTDGTRYNVLDQGVEMSITLYKDGRAEIKVNEETTAGFWTENEETITVTAEEKENLYIKVEDTLENEQDGTLMIFRKEKPEPGETK